MRSASRLSRERSTSRLCRPPSLARSLDVLSINENNKQGAQDVSSQEFVIHVGCDPQIRKQPEVTAIVTIFDTAMAGISSAINLLGLKIPDDVSFVGLGDEQGTELTTPSFTVLDFPASLMGYEAAKILINELDKGTKTVKQILIEPKLVIRSSTGLIRNTV